MKNVLAIIGAGALGQHIAHYAQLTDKFSRIVFVDDTLNVGSYSFGDVLGKLSEIDKLINADVFQNLLIGIGYNHMQKRKELFNKLNSSISFPNIIHSTCYIDKSTLMGIGNILLPGCIIDKGCTIGNNIFFNPGTIIAHDSNIMDHAFFGAGVNISGFVRTGSCCFFGTGTSTIENITIGDNVRTGASALITKNISEPGTYIGIPARKSNKVRP
jgi:sugar O-acyltransferase (sialic acid O-acetyltransferase NeuD family)